MSRSRIRTFQTRFPWAWLFCWVISLPTQAGVEIVETLYEFPHGSSKCEIIKAFEAGNRYPPNTPPILVNYNKNKFGPQRSTKDNYLDPFTDAIDLEEITADSIRRNFGKPIQKLPSYPRQEVFSDRELREGEKNAVDTMFKVARDPERLRSRSIDPEINEALYNQSELSSLFSKEEFDRWSRALQDHGQIEVGVWRGVLISGYAISVVFTSNLINSTGNVLEGLKALDNELKDLGYSIGLVMELQFFHNHPELQPINLFDVEALQVVDKSIGDGIGVHVYAVSELDRNERAVFHHLYMSEDDIEKRFRRL